MATDAALATSFASRSPFCPTLHPIADAEITRRQYVNTANAATASGVAGGQVWPYIALGQGFRRCLSSMPSDASRTPPVPRSECPNSEYIQPGEGMWDYAYTYDFAFSALIGAMMNDVKYLVQKRLS